MVSEPVVHRMALVASTLIGTVKRGYDSTELCVAGHKMACHAAVAILCFHNEIVARSF